jgi:hypothetical protein
VQPALGHGTNKLQCSKMSQFFPHSVKPLGATHPCQSARVSFTDCCRRAGRQDRRVCLLCACSRRSGGVQCVRDGQLHAISRTRGGRYKNATPTWAAAHSSLSARGCRARMDGIILTYRTCCAASRMLRSLRRNGSPPPPSSPAWGGRLPVGGFEAVCVFWCVRGAFSQEDHLKRGGWVH